jgi:VanZ family protein
MRRFSHLYKTGFDWAFKSNITHILMHVFLYAMLAWLVSLVFSHDKKIISPVKVLLIVLGVSVLQETIQLASIKYPVGWDDIFDVLVDLSGGLIGVLIFRWKRIRFRKGTRNP